MSSRTIQSATPSRRPPSAAASVKSLKSTGKKRKFRSGGESEDIVDSHDKIENSKCPSPVKSAVVQMADRILDHQWEREDLTKKCRSSKKVLKYLVKWQDSSVASDTWETAVSLQSYLGFQALELIESYWTDQKKTPVKSNGSSPDKQSPAKKVKLLVSDLNETDLVLNENRSVQAAMAVSMNGHLNGHHIDEDLADDQHFSTPNSCEKRRKNGRFQKNYATQREKNEGKEKNRQENCSPHQDASTSNLSTPSPAASSTSSTIFATNLDEGNFVSSGGAASGGATSASNFDRTFFKTLKTKVEELENDKKILSESLNEMKIDLIEQKKKTREIEDRYTALSRSVEVGDKLELQMTELLMAYEVIFGNLAYENRISAIETERSHLRHQLANGVAVQLQLFNENRMLKRAWDAIGDVDKVIKSLRDSVQSNSNSNASNSNSNESPTVDETQENSKNASVAEHKNNQEKISSVLFEMNGSNHTDTAAFNLPFDPILPCN